jgi:Raf kinase inhibitor-like YbhB/YbcL family protein
MEKMGTRSRRLLMAALVAALLSAGIVVGALFVLSRPSATVSTEQESSMSFPINSPAFAAGKRIPVRHTGDGDDVSPPLSWSGVPDGTREFALICDDPDAPTDEPWVHWVIYGIPGETRALPEGVPPDRQLESPVAAVQGKNSWSSGRTVGYRGPAPPKGHGTHHYHFKLYALDAKLALKPGAEKAALLKAMAGHVLAEGELIGTYER